MVRGKKRQRTKVATVAASVIFTTLRTRHNPRIFELVTLINKNYMEISCFCFSYIVFSLLLRCRFQILLFKRFVILNPKNDRNSV